MSAGTLRRVVPIAIVASACALGGAVEGAGERDGKRRPSMQTGRASWYGSAFHGRTTASGEPFDMHAFTAAHRTLPFGTWLLVENVRNGRKIRVRINDRGPAHEGITLDLSRAAARELGGARRGIMSVRFRVINPVD